MQPSCQRAGLGQACGLQHLEFNSALKVFLNYLIHGSNGSGHYPGFLLKSGLKNPTLVRLHVIKKEKLTKKLQAYINTQIHVCIQTFFFSCARILKQLGPYGKLSNDPSS